MDRMLAKADSGLLRGGLKLTHLRLLIALEDKGQMSAAAAALNMTQPAASRLAGELEKIAGTKLYRRTARGIELSPSGRLFAQRARAALLEIVDAERDLAALASGGGGTVAIGTVTAPAIDLVVPALKAIRLQYPAIQVHVQVETSQVLVRELTDAHLDFVIGRVPPDFDRRDFDIRLLEAEAVCFIARRHHPLSRRSQIALSDLSAYDWVLQPKGSPLRQTIENLFIAEGAPLPQKVFLTSSVLVTSVIVAETNAIAPISVAVAEFLTKQGVAAGGLRKLNVSASPIVEPYGLIKSRRRTLSAAARVVYDAVLSQWDRLR